MQILQRVILLVILNLALQACQSTEPMTQSKVTENNVIYATNTIWFKSYYFVIQGQKGLLIYQQSSKLNADNPAVTITLKKTTAPGQYMQFQDSEGKITVKVIQPNKAYLQLNKVRYNLHPIDFNSQKLNKDIKKIITQGKK
ncbi:hypothetical protein [Myroides sp. LJL119]